MAVLQVEIDWYPNGGQDPVISISDYEGISVRVGSTPKSNSCNIKLKNRPELYTDADGNIKFDTEDVFKIYAKQNIDGSALDKSSNSNDLLMVAELKEISVKIENNTTMLTLKCVDRTFTLLNRVWVFPYTADDTSAPNGTGWTAPEIVQNVIRNTTDNSNKHQNVLFDGDGDKPGIYEVDARMFIGGEGTESAISSGTTDGTTAMKLVDSGATFSTDGVVVGDNVYNSTDRTWAIATAVEETNLTLTKDIFVSGEGYAVNDAFIAHKRPLLGTPDSDTDLFPSADNTNFPFISMAKSFKPVYEWITGLSQIQNCNTIDENNATVTGTTLVVRKAMRYYVDEKYRFHWFYPDLTPELYFTEGTTTAIGSDTKGHKIKAITGKKAVYDIINFVIFRAGEDMNGAQILGYEYSKDTNVQLKDSYRPFLSIAQRMKENDYTAGNLQRAATGDSRYYDYPAAYPVTPAWDDSQRAVGSDSAYNTNFREIAIKRGKERAKDLIENRGRARWKLGLTIDGENLTPADLIRFNSSSIGIVNLDVRITGITHNIGAGGWTTALTLEEDESEEE
jgi:hypothetical protein